MARGLGLPLLLGGVLVGGLSYALMRSARAESPPGDPGASPGAGDGSQREVDTNFGGSGEAKPPPKDPADIQTDRQPGSPEPRSSVPLSWTLASVVLSDLADPYNPGVPRRGNVTAIFNTDSYVALGWQAIKTAAAATQGGGAVLELGIKLFNLIDENWNYGSGGYEKLTPLQRKRAVVLGVDRPGDPAQLARLPPTATPEQRVAWSRKYLVQLGRYLEWDRVTSTPDEPFLPVALIQQLIDVKLWPPPIEPVDPFGCLYFPDSEIPTRRFTPQKVPMQPEEIEGFRTAYEQLRVEYEPRAALFAQAVSLAGWPPDIVELARKFGSLPRRGSAALPIPVDAKKGGM